MPAKILKFTLRIESDMLEKFRFIAKSHGRSANFELKILMKKYIEKYEQQYGPIRPDI